MLKPIGIVILYDRKEGTPEELSSKFAAEFFSQVSENVIKEKMLSLGEMKELLDSKMLFYGGIKEKFDEFTNNPEVLGQIAWKVFYDHTGKEPIDDVKLVIFNGDNVPWNHSIAACVLYDSI